MPLKLHFHPLSSFCHKALIALYENDTPFEPHIVNLMDAKERAAFLKLWPVGKFPVLQDGDRIIPESSVVIEYLDLHFPGRTRFIPADAKLAAEARARDRLFDWYVNVPVGKIVTDRLRSPGRNDPQGVDDARALLRTALDLVERDMTSKTWAVGDVFTLADCAAAPSLFFANKIMPFEGTHKNAAAYLKRLTERPSYARALKEAEPYFAMMPKG